MTATEIRARTVPTLTLRFDLDGPAPGWSAGRNATAIAALLASVQALGFASHEAERTGVPLTHLLAHWTDTDTPPPLDIPVPLVNPQVLVDLWWALRRTVKVDVLPSRGERQKLPPRKRPEGAASSVPVVRLTLGSPLEIVAQLPWEWFGPAGGGLLFVKALEQWLNAPARIRAERARLDEQRAVSAANIAQARVRQAQAEEELYRLRGNGTPPLLDGELALDD
jgi:hypothetical protein